MRHHFLVLAAIVCIQYVVTSSGKKLDEFIVAVSSLWSFICGVWVKENEREHMILLFFSRSLSTVCSFTYLSACSSVRIHMREMAS
jgi:hypothetical protein